MVTKKQALAGAGILAAGAYVALTPAGKVRAFNFAWNMGSKAVVAHTTLAPAYEAYRDDKKLTFGYGHKGHTKLKNVPYYGRYFRAGAGNLVVPTFGIGLTSKKVNKSSRGGSATTSTSMHESAPSASKLRRLRKRRAYQNRKRRVLRCRKVSRGRRCKLPAGHSGRHSYV